MLPMCACGLGLQTQGVGLLCVEGGAVSKTTGAGKLSPLASSGHRPPQQADVYCVKTMRLLLSDRSSRLLN